MLRKRRRVHVRLERIAGDGGRGRRKAAPDGDKKINTLFELFAVIHTYTRTRTHFLYYTLRQHALLRTCEAGPMRLFIDYDFFLWVSAKPHKALRRRDRNLLVLTV